MYTIATPLQGQLFPPEKTIIVHQRDVRDAWEWLVRYMSPRPSVNSSLCIYDLKAWKGGRDLKPLEPEPTVTCRLGRLFLISEIGDFKTIIDMVNGKDSLDIAIYEEKLDRDVKNIIDSKRRFRNALSEHLAFWVRLATAAQRGSPGERFTSSKPNIQPEDKGPDGVFVRAAQTTEVEVQSVKSSINDPAYAVASKSFRRNGRAKRGRQLDDFWFKVNESWGITRLDDLLSRALAPLNFSASESVRRGLLLDCAYNAIVVADHKYAKIEMFDGYQFVTDKLERRVATYIGATSWAEVAENARKDVRKILKAVGVW